MKRSFTLLTLTLTLALQLQAQCGGKGLKAIDAKDYKTAWSSLEDCLASDPDDISAHFGMSRLYGIGEAGKKDKDKALEHLKKAEAGWSQLDDKGKAKYDKVGINNAAMEERRTRIESTFLEAAKAANTVQAFEDFLLAFPNSAHSTTCRNYRNDLAYKLADQSGTVDALDDYLMTYPDAENYADATKVRDLKASAVALKADTEEALKHFISRYPNALQAPQVRQRLNAVAFENAKAANTAAAFRDYIAQYPESVFITQAKEKLEWLEANGQK